MSNPPSTYAPTPYFPGIIYSPSDFIENSTTAVLTYAEALRLFLQKNTPIPLLYAPSALTSETQLGYSVTSTFTAVAFVSGTSTIIRSLQVPVTGVYLVTWQIQYAGGVVPSVYYSVIANTTSATLKTPQVTQGNWGNATLGNPGGQPFQTTHGSIVIGVTANNYLNLILFFNGTGGLSTDCGYLQYTRIG